MATAVAATTNNLTDIAKAIDSTITMVEVEVLSAFVTSQ